MVTENKNLSKSNEECINDIYTPDEVDAINKLLIYMANIKYLPRHLLGDSPGIKFEPYLNNKEGE